MVVVRCVGLVPTVLVMGSTGRYPAALGGALGIDPTGWAATNTVLAMVNVRYKKAGRARYSRYVQTNVRDESGPRLVGYAGAGPHTVVSKGMCID